MGWRRLWTVYLGEDRDSVFEDTVHTRLVNRQNKYAFVLLGEETQRRKPPGRDNEKIAKRTGLRIGHYQERAMA